MDRPNNQYRDKDTFGKLMSMTVADPKTTGQTPLFQGRVPQIVMNVGVGQPRHQKQGQKGRQKATQHT
ncbi:MAG: hypothetical protein KDD43_10445 [Bdellovibrionales bacterium]|nr:hypothetical protein [Bdellovibrionales bacterium]